MKTPDEIKKGLEYLSITNVAEKVERFKQGLQYAYTEDVAADALALIQQHEAGIENLSMIVADAYKQRDRLAERVKQLEAERNDLRNGLMNATGCRECKHFNNDAGQVPDICMRCRNCSTWEWRGVQEGRAE